MKRILVLMLMLSLILGVSVSADTIPTSLSDVSEYKLVKSDDALFQVVGELYIDGKLESKTVEDYKGNYYAKGIGLRKVSDLDAAPMGIIYYEDFQCYSDVIENAKTLKNGVLSVGVSTTTYFCKWIETWEVDQFGNKIDLVERDAPKILVDDCNNEYTVIPLFDVTRTTWTVTKSKASAAGYTELVSSGATTSYTHNAYPQY